MDSLKILKLSGNPWNETIINLLKAEEHAASSQVPVAEHENEARITSQVKKFLRTEAASMDSGGESRYVTLPRISSGVLLISD
jgi:hypothetical protein